MKEGIFSFLTCNSEQKKSLKVYVQKNLFVAFLFLFTYMHFHKEKKSKILFKKLLKNKIKLFTTLAKF